VPTFAFIVFGRRRGSFHKELLEIFAEQGRDDWAHDAAIRCVRRIKERDPDLWADVWPETHRITHATDADRGIGGCH
jgi:hypothetical protein